MDNVKNVPQNARSPGNFWGAPDDFDPETLEQEFSDSVNPEEEALRRAESEEQVHLDEAMHAEVSQLTPQQRKLVADLEQADRDKAHDEAWCCEYAEFLRIQAEQEQILKENPFWNRPMTSSESPVNAETTIAAPKSTEPVSAEPNGVEIASILPPPMVNMPLPMEILACTQGKRMLIENPTPYTAMKWILENIPVVRTGGMLYFYENGAYLPRKRDEAWQIIMEVCRPAIEMLGNASLVKKTYELLYMEPRISRDIGYQGNYVAFHDCILDATTGVTLPHTPDLFVTTRLNASYAKGMSTDCPAFKQYLRSATGGDTVLERRIWQAIGYLLVPDQTGKSFILFQGVTHSGKSILGDFIRESFMGQVVSQLDVNDMGGNFALADLVGKRLCVDLDMSADPFNKKAVSKLKKMTGGDPLSSDVKFADRVQFKCTAKFLLATNHAILLPNKDEAFNKRMIVVPFKISVPKERQDFSLPRKLAYERDAIIVQALQYYRDLVACKGIFAGDYVANEAVDEDGESYLNAIAAFMSEYCEFGEAAWTPTSVLYSTFMDTTAASCDLNAFSSAFLRLCNARNAPVEKARGRLTPSANPVWGFKGVRIKIGGNM